MPVQHTNNVERVLTDVVPMFLGFGAGVGRRIHLGDMENMLNHLEAIGWMAAGTVVVFFVQQGCKLVWKKIHLI